MFGRGKSLHELIGEMREESRGRHAETSAYLEQMREEFRQRKEEIERSGKEHKEEIERSAKEHKEETERSGRERKEEFERSGRERKEEFERSERERKKEFERLMKESERRSEETREFNREILLRNEKVYTAMIAQLEENTAQTRAHTKAVLNLLDRFNGPDGLAA